MQASRPALGHRPSEEHLLLDEDTEMADLQHPREDHKNSPQVRTQYSDDPGGNGEGSASHALHEVSTTETEPAEQQPVYKVYRTRWFGLFQLVLLNIIVSWDVSFPPPCSYPSRLTIPFSSHSGSPILQSPTPRQPFSIPRRQLSTGSAQRSSSPSSSLPLRLSMHCTPRAPASL